MTETADLEREKAAVATAGGVTETAYSSFLAKEIVDAVAAAVAVAAVVISATAETVNAVVPRDSAGITVGPVHVPVPVEFSAVEVFVDCVP